MDSSIRVYDTNGGTLLSLVAYLQPKDYESCIFKRSRSEVGTFQIVVNGKLPKTQYLVTGNMIWVGRVRSRVGLITAVSKSASGNEEKWTVSGIEAKGITQWRTIQYTGFSHYVLSGTAEYVIKSAITRFLGTGAETARKIDLINVPTNNNEGSSYLLSERFSQLSDALTSCSEATGQWWRFEINPTTRLLDVYATAPTDRTVTQSVNPRAPFSEKFLTVETLDYSEDQSEYVNFAIVAGSGEDTARIVQTVGAATGWNRREAFYDARDLTSTSDLTERGTSKLAEVADTIGVDITAMTRSQLKPDVDYFVGDLCTVSAFGIEQDKAITMISESWDNSGYSVDLTFGKAVATRKRDINRVKDATFRATSV